MKATSDFRRPLLFSSLLFSLQFSSQFTSLLSSLHFTSVHSPLTSHPGGHCPLGPAKTGHGISDIVSNSGPAQKSSSPPIISPPVLPSSSSSSSSPPSPLGSRQHPPPPYSHPSLQNSAAQPGGQGEPGAEGREGQTEPSVPMYQEPAQRSGEGGGVWGEGGVSVLGIVGC